MTHITSHVLRAGVISNTLKLKCPGDYFCAHTQHKGRGDNWNNWEISLSIDLDFVQAEFGLLPLLLERVGLWIRCFLLFPPSAWCQRGLWWGVLMTAEICRQKFDRNTMVTPALRDLVGGKPLQKISQGRQGEVLCAHKFLLWKTRRFHVPVSWDKCDQTAGVPVEQRAVHSPGEAGWHSGLLHRHWECCSSETGVRVSNLTLARLFCHLFLCSACPELSGFL